MKAEYRLVYKGQEDQSLETRNNVIELLRDQFGLGRIVEVEELIDNPPFIVKRSQSKSELIKDAKVFQGAGAATIIVPTVQNTQKLAERIHKQTISTKKRESASTSFESFYRKYSDKLHAIISALDVGQVEALGQELLEARKNNRQIFIFGNGGSAAAASHLVNDLAKQRFPEEKSLFRIMSLNDNVPLMSATANDVGYDHIFSGQLKNLLQPHDLVVAISSSGNSKNITNAIEYANKKGARTFGIVGFDGGKLLQAAQQCIYIPTKKGHYGYMEDVTGILGHMLSIYIYERDCAVWGKN